MLPASASARRVVRVDVTIVGASGSFAGPRSPASSYVVRQEHEGRVWSIVLDLGNGALGALQRHLVPTAVDAVLISHLHVDHFIDLCGLYVMMKYAPAQGGAGPEPAREPIRLHAPVGAEERLASAYGDIEPGGMQVAFDFHEIAPEQPIEIGPFRVTPIRVDHPIEAYGFRVEAGGRVLVYTGDTDSCAALTPLMRDADLVIADSAFVEGRDEVRGIHLSGRRAAEAAVAAGGVKRLMLSHIPSWNDPEVCRAQAGEVWPGGQDAVELAEPDATYRV